MSPRKFDDDTTLLEMDLPPVATRTTPNPIGFRPPAASLVTALATVTAVDTAAKAAAVQRALAVAAKAAAVAPVKEEISVKARDLAAAEHAVATEHGLVGGALDEGLFYTAGTQLWDVGNANLKAYDAEYKALPTLSAVAASHAATIKAEDRKDTTRSLAGYRLDTSGQLRALMAVSPDGIPTFGTNATAVSAQALSQIKAYYPHDRSLLRGRAEARNESADERNASKRAEWPKDKPLPAAPSNLNGWLGDLATVKDPKGAPVQHLLRARTNRGQREVFGVFSSSARRGYATYDTDRMLSLAAKSQPNLRVDLRYDADTTRMRARCIAQAPIDIPAFTGVGRVHQVGFDLRSADDGSMALQVDPFLIRVRCKNASLVRTNGKKSRFRHVGSFRTLEEGLQNAIANANKAIDAMRDLWARAAIEHYRDSESGEQLSVQESIERLVAHDLLPCGGLDPDEAVKNYMHAWRAEESPHSAQGVIMAVQRAAHEGSWSTRWGVEDEIEEAASNLLYQHVYVLDTVESAEA